MDYELHGLTSPSQLLFDACPKCVTPQGIKGPMRLNIDRDLSCVYCGKVVYLFVRSRNDSRASQSRDHTEENGRGDMDESSSVAPRRVWGGSSPHNNSTVVRQGGLFNR